MTQRAMDVASRNDGDEGATALDAPADAKAGPGANLAPERPEPPPPFSGHPICLRKILVSIDFSPASAKALKTAVALANQCNAALTILHVIDINAQAAYGTAQELMRGLWEKAAAQLGETAGFYTGRINAQTLLAEGLPWDVIVAKSCEFDLVVVGRNRARTRWKLFSHRTAHGVAEKANCPVLLVNED